MGCYFCITNDLSFVKIGVSIDHVKRFHGLKTSCPYDFTMIFFPRKGKEMEEELHERFKSFHHKGEWFFLVKEIVEEITKNYESEGSIIYGEFRRDIISMINEGKEIERMETEKEKREENKRVKLLEKQREREERLRPQSKREKKQEKLLEQFLKEKKKPQKL